MTTVPTPMAFSIERTARAVILTAMQNFVAEYDPGHTPTSSDIAEFHGYLPNTPEPTVVALLTEALGLQELVERWDDDDPACIAATKQRDELLTDAIRTDRTAGAR